MESNPNPNHMVPPTPAVDPPPHPLPSTQSHPQPIFSFPRRPALRVTTEFDSDSAIFFHKISCKLLDTLAKFKLSFHNNSKGEISEPQLSFVSKHLSLHYDLEDQNALVKSSFDVGPKLHFKAAHDVKAQQGEVTMLANLADPGYALELSTPVPSVGLGQILDGVGTAHYKDEELKLRYCYKDDELSFIPTFSVPSNALSFAFKRRLTPSDKLSYWYNCDSNFWSAVYKRTYGKDFKFKAGYDSEVRLGWASLWVGDESGKAKAAPMKMKVQFMLQVPQDDIASSVLMFRVKKRWDI
ncbi:Outer envelope pore protein 37, chloroplastic [Stylosanthes scabra]|uniref:Outer envelope pore protein 37, chloroplastic n=1 Tax=Stylosanthes scabra TaxID=79078 RepID=A0ABU6Y5G9_9FABA|nr:Outer envelope pore protein 37, chloroplastic [Stylosanthes scabra]